MGFNHRKGVEVNVWDLNECTKIWTAKSVSSSSPSITAEKK